MVTFHLSISNSKLRHLLLEGIEIVLIQREYFDILNIHHAIFPFALKRRYRLKPCLLYLLLEKSIETETVSRPIDRGELAWWDHRDRNLLLLFFASHLSRV